MKSLLIHCVQLVVAFMGLYFAVASTKGDSKRNRLNTFLAIICIAFANINFAPEKELSENN